MVNINRRYNVINARAFKARALFFFFTAFAAGRQKTPRMNIKRIFIHFLQIPHYIIIQIFIILLIL